MLYKSLRPCYKTSHSVHAINAFHCASRHPSPSHQARSGAYPSSNSSPSSIFYFRGSASIIKRPTPFMLKHFTALPVIRQGTDPAQSRALSTPKPSPFSSLREAATNGTLQTESERFPSSASPLPKSNQHRFPLSNSPPLEYIFFLRREGDEDSPPA